ncbi:mitochondrial translation release factor in rescue-like [Styela clava]
MFGWRNVFNHRRIVQYLYTSSPTELNVITAKINICISACFNKFHDEIQKVRKLDKKLIELKEEDLAEYQVKGSGGGGQKTNKTSNCIVLSHVPTGLSVRVHDSRSILENQKIARAKLRLKVDVHIRGDDSVLVQEQKRNRLWKKHGKKQAEERLERKSKLKAILEQNDDIKY